MRNKDFYIGTASAAHQVEGNNTNNDCWVLENIEHSVYVDKSGIACDHYNRYKEDINLMRDAGYNAYRFSIEWARIEPNEGEFDEDAINHYLDVIRYCKANGLEPFVTLHHFSSPKWLISKGGWDTESVIDNFRKYAAYVVDKIQDEVKFIMTINEANIRLQIADISKRYHLLAQQQEKSNDDVASVEGSIQMGMNLKAIMEHQALSAKEGAEAFGIEDPNAVHVFQSATDMEGDLIICKAHVAAREAIREINPNLKVGLSLSLHDFQPLEGYEDLAEEEWHKEFTHYLEFIEEDDYLGVQNYTRSIIGEGGLQPSPKGAELTDAGYEYYPEGLENVIRKVAKDYKGDLYVTENGIATENDKRRVAFIKTALEGIQNTVDDGIPVKGYLHWTLMDNFEWQKGYSLKFGLIEVNRETMERTPKESFTYLAEYNK